MIPRLRLFSLKAHQALAPCKVIVKSLRKELHELSNIVDIKLKLITLPLSLYIYVYIWKYI